jgi:outer membrane receptor protein involved in Fe transport
VNFADAPFTEAERMRDQLSPKVGLTLTPWMGATWRGAYTRSLGGVSFERSFQLEPVQVAGFTQAYRGLVPESVAGLVPGQEMRIWGVAVEQKLKPGTYLAIGVQQAESSAQRGVGAFLYDPAEAGYVPRTLTESLEFRERTLSANASQLVGQWLALGADYRLSEAELHTVFPLDARIAMDQRAVLHRVELSARFNHPSGWFARWDSVWHQQSNQDDAAKPKFGGGPGDDFWQHNLWTGWRFFRRRAEVSVGILNLTDQDYRLHPLNYHLETYRHRTIAVSARISL